MAWKRQLNVWKRFQMRSTDEKIDKQMNSIHIRYTSIREIGGRTHALFFGVAIFCG